MTCMVILPIGTTEASHGTRCLVVTTEEVSASQNVTVDLYQQSLTNLLQFIHPEKSMVHVNNFMVLEADTPSPSHKTSAPSPKAMCSTFSEVWVISEG